ncbi:MAG: cytochrome c oxidase assembly protein [Alphaproteobacteria bacterium]|nr:cytochrome c oxidase assembly protein [Alphaproteobacteria bacterium]
MNNLKNKNNKSAAFIAAIVLGMIALSFASVPLYRVFCRVTGFDGTVQVGGKAPDKIDKRQVTISFDARVDSGLPWEFRPETRKMDVHVGQQALVSFMGTNLSANDTIGTAVYNVVPEKAGIYFHKTQCFCFAKQELGPGKTAHFPVMFYLDPAMLADREMDDVTDITLSYTFFPTDSKALDRAIENYGQ